MPYRFTIPMAIQLVIEDVGWWEKSHPLGPNDPFRSGLHRRHHPSDYAALVELAKGLGMRPLIAFVACEWDRFNILKKIPTATWMGENWDNRHNVGPWLDQAADILKTNRSHLEIALHGVGHEYWAAGTRSRTEFHTSEGNLRPAGEIERHLAAFGEIMGQHDLPSCPTAFVPPALKHSFGNGEHGIHPILNRYGIHDVITVLNKARLHRPPQHARLAWEEGVLLIERGPAPVPWHTSAARPRFRFERPFVPLHWANLLHENGSRNSAVVRDWIAFIKKGYDRAEQMLAPDTATCISQLAYQTLARVRQSATAITIDLRKIRQLPAGSILPVIHANIIGDAPTAWRIQGGRIVRCQKPCTDVHALTIHIHDNCDILRLTPAEKRAPA